MEKPKSANCVPKVEAAARPAVDCCILPPHPTLPENSRGCLGRGWCPPGLSPGLWWGRPAPRLTSPEDFWVWTGAGPVAPSDCPSSPPPSPSPPSNTSGSGRTGNGFFFSCPPGSSCPPGRRTWRSSAPSSWRIPCSPRRCGRHSAGRQHCPHTRHRAATGTGAEIKALNYSWRSARAATTARDAV